MEEYNYVLVDVQPGQQTKFTLNRFRPRSAEPFASGELFRSSIQLKAGVCRRPAGSVEEPGQALVVDPSR